MKMKTQFTKHLFSLLVCLVFVLICLPGFTLPVNALDIDIPGLDDIPTGPLPTFNQYLEFEIADTYSDYTSMIGKTVMQ